MDPSSNTDRPAPLDAPDAGIDAAALGRWLAEEVPGAKGPFTYTLIAGGKSNLTYRVDDASGNRFVVRRPPLGHVLATAHDMGREHRIVSALQDTAVPVPPTLAHCPDPAVLGAPFYVMRFVDGHVLRDQATAEAALDESARRSAGMSLVDVLAAIHALDVEQVGLGRLSRSDGYVARQLKRWYAQFQASNELTGRPVPDVHTAHTALSARIPEQQGVALVHGDYRLDNCVVANDGRIHSVLDWELCTLGDPLADLGLLLVYWDEPDDPETTLVSNPTLAPGFPRRDEVVDRYLLSTQRDLAELDFYVALGFWKLACIMEGVYSRFASGVMAADADHSVFERQVVQLARRATEVVERLPA